MTLPFLPFPKIPTTGIEALLRDAWVASEKIHGAQLVVGVDAVELRIGKRKAWLAPDEAFFGLADVAADLARRRAGNSSCAPSNERGPDEESKLLSYLRE